MEWTTQIIGAAAVPAALAALLWWLRRRGWAVAAAAGPRGAGRRLRSVERLALGPQHTLHLVSVDREALLVACSPAGCSLLERVPADREGRP